LGVEDWAEIRRLHRAERVPIKEIARVLGISKNTVRAAVRAGVAPTYERPAGGSLTDSFEPRIRELLQAVPRMPATVIAERIDWPHSIRTLSGRVAELRPYYLPADPSGRTVYAPGEIAQCDFWFPDIIPLARQSRPPARPDPARPPHPLILRHRPWAADRDLPHPRPQAAARRGTV